MQIAGIDPNRSVSSSDATGDSRLGKDQFLKLMMAQLANQDPTSPQSNEAFIAQLAQFASVEQMQTVNGNLEALLVAQAAGNQLGAAQLVGSDVFYRTDKVSLDGSGAVTPMEIELPASASEVVVTIKDESGKVVDTVTLGPQDAGKVPFTWDGVDANGDPLPPGTYQVEVSATTPEGGVMDGISLSALGHVDAISFANGAPELILGTLKIPLGDVVEVREASSRAAATGQTGADDETPASKQAFTGQELR